jgi:hypothetical protein
MVRALRETGPPIAGLTFPAGPQGEVMTIDGVDYCLKMQATLSGQDFSTGPEGPVAGAAMAGRPARWDWILKPLSHGPDKPQDAPPPKLRAGARGPAAGQSDAARLSR